MDPPGAGIHPGGNQRHPIIACSGRQCNPGSPAELLAACRWRNEKAADETERRHLAEVEAKLLRAQRIEESARRRSWQRAFAAFVGVEPPPDDEA